MARTPGENNSIKSNYETFNKRNVLRQLYEDTRCYQDKESTDYSFNNSIIEKIQSSHDKEPNIDYRSQWKNNQNRVSFEDEQDSLEYCVKNDIKQKHNHRNDHFLQRVNILKQKLNIIDDYKVNTEIYEKSKHLIDVDSLEVQIRRSPCLAAKYTEETNSINTKDQNKENLILEPKSKFCINDDCAKKETKTNIKITDYATNYAITKQAEDSHDFLETNQVPKTVTVVIENTRTPTGTRSHFIRNFLDINKFDPDSIDGHQLDDTGHIEHDFDFESRNQNVQEENGFASHKHSERLETLKSDLKSVIVHIDNGDAEIVLESVNVDIKNGDVQVENFTSSESVFSVNDDTAHIYEPMSLSIVDNQEANNPGDHTESPTVDVEAIEKVTETPKIPAEQNFVKFKAKRFLQKKLSMKDNEILQVLKEVKENDQKDRKQNKACSYDLSSPELSSGQSSTHSLIESSTPGRENWRLRESDRSKSSSTCKYLF